MRSNWARVLVALPAVWIGAFGDRSQILNASDRDPIAPTEGLSFRLSEGEPGHEPTPTARPRPAPALPMSDADAQALFAPLPPLKMEDEQPGFALRDKSLPPPKAGRTLLSPFPRREERTRPSKGNPGPLRVLRRAPEGEVDVAPRLSVTFSQPMVAVASHENLAAKAVPVQLEPQPEGQWRWLGTQTLVFEPTTRFPKATDYRVRVAAGTRSASGGSLTAHATWTFRTPPPKILHTYPCCDGNRGDTPFVVVFDQRIDPQAMLAKLRVKAGDPAAIQTLRLATVEEVRADPEAWKTWKKAPEGQAMAFRTIASLPPDTRVEVVLEAGAPSVEGPKRTQDPESWTFRTFGPLRIAKHGCGSGSNKERCTPGMPWLIEFNNKLDEERFREDSVRVEPSVSGLRIAVSGNTLTLSGHVRGRTTYRVTLSAELADVHRQSLGQEQTVSISVGEGRPGLMAPGQGLVVLDPAAAKPSFSVYSTELSALRVVAYGVEPRDWSAFQRWLRMETARAGEKRNPPGRHLFSREIRVEAPPEETTETKIDLSPFLPRGRGHVLLVVEDVSIPPNGVAMPPAPQVVRWIQSSRIGLAAYVDHAKLVAWASSLADGRPLPGVNVQLLEGGSSARTDANGLAVLPLGPNKTSALIARAGDDTALLPPLHYGWYGDGGWERREARDNLAWYVFDDRQLYRPGEEVKIKGWIRVAGAGPTGDIRPLSGVAPALSYALQDPQGNEIANGEAPIDATFGAFDLSLALPRTMSLGWAQLELKAGAPERDGGQHTHGFQVQEFRRPEFEVRARATDGPHFVGGHAGITATASYFAGGALPDSRVSWHVTSSTTSFTPPNRGDFHFGTWVPWWQFNESGGRWHTKAYEGNTDAAGNHRLRIDFEAARPPVPALVRAQATIEDVNRQSWSDAVQLLVHPADLYVGLRSDRAFVQKGTALGVDVIVTDLDGRAIGGRAVSVRSERIEWVWDRRSQKWAEKRLDTRERTITSTEDAQRLVVETPEGGTYRVTASVVDEQERLNQTDMTFWVAGGRAAGGATTSADVVTLVPDKKEYRPGETAEILVVAPFAPAEGLLTLRRSGILRTERFTMAGSSHTLHIPIEKGWIPNVAIHVDLVGAATRSGAAGDPDPKLPKRPAFAVGGIDLPIPPFERTLAVAVSPRERTLEPRGRTTLDLLVKDAQARPVADAETAVVVVDEAILSLAGYAIPDPVGQVYAHRPTETSDHHIRQLVIQATLSDEEGFDTRVGAMAEAIEVRASAAGMAKTLEFGPAGPGGPSSSPIRLRSNFNPLAHFSARVRTDTEGRAAVPIQLPDNLTRYRITVVAATSGAQFGKGESTLTARLPLMARLSPPRFLNFGDEAEVPVLIQNQTDGPVPVAVALRGANVDRVGAGGFRATVPSQDRVEVRFPVKTIGPGMARLQVVAVSGAANDAAEVEFPVWTPATTEAFATYGQIDADGVVVQPVEAPRDAVPRFGGLELTTSSTALQALTDAFLYLVTYPFECAEQVASRLLAVVALRDVLTAFAAEGLPPPEELASSVARDVARLEALQRYDGGFGFWRQGDASLPYLSIHAAHALQRAREHGFHIADEMLERSRRYLRKIDDHIPKDCDAHVRRTLMAYALYVRHRMEDLDTDGARTLVQENGPEGLSFEALGWLLPVLSEGANSEGEIDAIRKHLANSVTETAAAAHFADSYQDRGHLLLHSDRRADAVLLEALIGDEPSSDLIPKLVQGLLGHRKKGRWSNTQENAFVLLALDRYFRTYEKASPDFVARAWLGDSYAGEHSFHGRSADRNRIDVPMGMLLATGPSTNLVLSKEGAGRLYYRIGMQYAPANLRLESMDRGFTVERRYEGADAPSDVRRDQDGTWRVRAGCRVRVRVTLLAPASRHHVALVDPVPAGLEPLNPELTAVGSVPEDENIDDEQSPWIRWWRWFEHQNLRDERVEAFTSLLPDGVYSYSYVARATTPGRFVVPPPRAEEMYEPETFGRGRTDFVLVE